MGGKGELFVHGESFQIAANKSSALPLFKTIESIQVQCLLVAGLAGRCIQSRVWKQFSPRCPQATSLGFAVCSEDSNHRHLKKCCSSSVGN